MDPAAQQDSPRARWVVGLLSLMVFALVGLSMRRMPDGVEGVGPSLLAQTNALLNAAAAVCLVVGFIKIKRGDMEGHKHWMIAAFSISTLFLVTYVMHHMQVGSVRFTGVGWVRTLYFSILIPHIVLAAAVLPLSLMTLYRGYTNKRVSHRRMAKYTLPIWFYVSASGVAVYFMLYHL